MKGQNIIKVLVLFISMLILSCNGDDNSNVIYTINEESSLVKNYEKVLRNQEVIFDLIGDNSTNYTEFATFYVDGAAIEGNVFSSSVEGVFNVYAEYDLAGTMTTTNTSSVEVFIPKRKVLIEGFTGTWCGFCPRIVSAKKEIREQSEDVVLVSIHGNSISTGTDPLVISEGMFLKNYFEVPGYPTGNINRNEFWEYGDAPLWEFLISQPLAYAGTEVNTSIGINSQLIGVDLKVDVKVISEEDISNKKIVVFLLEDNILLDQVSYFDNVPESPWYQMGVIIEDFEHNDVLRKSLTYPLGDSIPDTAALEEYSISFDSFILPNYNSSKLSIVAMVVNEDDTVINAQFAEVNENKSYE